MEILDQLAVILENGQIALFAALWVLGFMLKNYTSLNNIYIPWIVVVSGIVLANVLLSISIHAGIFGAAIGLFVVGGHSFLKHTIELSKE